MKAAGAYQFDTKGLKYTNIVTEKVVLGKYTGQDISNTGNGIGKFTYANNSLIEEGVFLATNSKTKKEYKLTG